MINDNLKQLLTGNKIRDTQGEANLIKFGRISAIGTDDTTGLYNGTVTVSLEGDSEGVVVSDVLFPSIINSSGSGQVIYPEENLKVSLSFVDGVYPVVLACYPKDFILRFGKLGVNRQAKDAQGVPITMDMEDPYKPVEMPSRGEHVVYGENVSAKFGKNLDVVAYTKQESGAMLGTKALKVQMGTGLTAFNGLTPLEGVDGSKVNFALAGSNHEISTTEKGTLSFNNNQIVFPKDATNEAKSTGWKIVVGSDNTLMISNSTGDAIKITEDTCSYTNASGSGIHLNANEAIIKNGDGNLYKLNSEMAGVGILGKIQPSVFGEDLENLLKKLIDIFNNHTHPAGSYLGDGNSTQPGPVTGTSAPPTQQQKYEDIKTTTENK